MRSRSRDNEAQVRCIWVIREVKTQRGRKSMDPKQETSVRNTIKHHKTRNMRDIIKTTQPRDMISPSHVTTSKMFSSSSSLCFFQPASDFLNSSSRLEKFYLLSVHQKLNCHASVKHPRIECGMSLMVESEMQALESMICLLLKATIV